MMPVYESPKTETGTNEGSLTPARKVLHCLALLCNSQRAKDVEHEPTSRQIDSYGPFPSLWQAASKRTEPLSAAGASGRVSRGASSGEPTSAGAGNSQRTLHAAKRPTATAYRVALAEIRCVTQSLLASLQLWHWFLFLHL